MKALRRALAMVLVAAILLTLGLFGWAWFGARPQDLPWTPLRLDQPVGLFTGSKLAALHGHFAQCRALLDEAGVPYSVLPPVTEGANCGYDDALRLPAGDARRIAFAPANVGMSCPVAAAIAMWEWNVVQPAALRRFGSQVVTFEHLGSYNCRRIYGRAAGDWSEHAHANAIDVSGFRLADGTRVTVADDWHGRDAKAAFLHDVRDGACKLFATVLSPDYNAAHHNHLHLDQAVRPMGWHACR